MSDQPKSRGLACPRCAATRWCVLESRRSPGRITRVRECKQCELRVRTREVFEAVPSDAAKTCHISQ
jgi:transcriptional regulator NrdR family protein